MVQLIKSLSQNCDNKTKKSKISSRGADGVREWSAKSLNVQVGCEHCCLYCAPRASAARFKRKNPRKWDVVEVNKSALKKSIPKISGRIMFPTSHDISPSNAHYAIPYLERLLAEGNEVLVVTKPHLSVVKEMCKTLAPYRKQLLFRFTIGSSKSKILKFWEPGAPSFKERYKSLVYAHSHGFQTSVSCEPCLDADIEPLIEKLLPHVADAIWIGRPNMLMARTSINGYKDNETRERTRKLLSELSDDWVRNLYKKYKSNRRIKWKAGLKRVLGLPLSTENGLDI